MLAARTFSAPRQCLRSIRVAPRFVAPVSQVPTPPPPTPPLLIEPYPLTIFRFFQLRGFASPADDAVAKFKGQKGSDVRLLSANRVFFGLPAPAAPRIAADEFPAPPDHP